MILSDHSTGEKTTRAIWWCIWEVTWGMSESGVPVSRSGLTSCRVCVYHVDNEHARERPAVTRDFLKAMLAEIAMFQVDFTRDGRSRGQAKGLLCHKQSL